MKSNIAILMALAGLLAAGGAVAAGMPQEARDTSSGHYCGICHKMDEKSIGPSWMEISKFYNGKTDKTTAGKTLKEVSQGMAIKDLLILKVAMGGEGNWGKQAMLPNNYVYGREDPKKREFIEKEVEFILNLAK